MNLKNLNTFIFYLYYKMEGLHLVKDVLKKKVDMCEVDLKDA